MSLLKKARNLAGAIKYSLHPRDVVFRLKRLRNAGEPMIIPLGQDTGLRVRIYPTDVIGRDIYRNGCFEPREVDVMRRLLKPGMVAFDVGANMGLYSLIAARKILPDGRVHSFEPSGRMFNELKFNVALNSLEGLCTLNNVAVSSSCGTAKLSRYGPGAEVYGSLGTQAWADVKPIGAEDVRTITLDGYISDNGIQRVDFIKMDIEGAELLALQGARQLLSRPDAPPILIEMADVNTAGFGYKAVEIWDLLQSHFYKFYGIVKSTGALVQAARPADFWLAQNLLGVKADSPLASSIGTCAS